MNNRIRQLAEQAWQWANNQVDIPKPQIVRFEEKFAELIVRECGIVADQCVNDEDNGQNLVSAKLKQHFGVEE